jgi:hypothetical protein
MLNKQPLPFLTASTSADRFEVTGGRRSKGASSLCLRRICVQKINFWPTIVNIILVFVPLRRKNGLKLAEKRNFYLFIRPKPANLNTKLVKILGVPAFRLSTHR